MFHESKVQSLTSHSPQVLVEVSGLVNSAKVSVPVKLVNNHAHKQNSNNGVDIVARLRYEVESRGNERFNNSNFVPHRIANVVTIKKKPDFGESGNGLYAFPIYFLQVRTLYSCTICCTDTECNQELARIEFQTKPPPSDVELDLFTRVAGQQSCRCVFYDTELTQSFIEECPFDSLMTVVDLSKFCSDDSKRAVRDLFAKLYRASLFTLPTNNSIIFLPSPLQRFCLDLRISTKIRWDRNKRMREYLKNFRLSVNHNFPLSLKELFRSKPIQGQGKWVTNWLYDTLVGMAEHGESEKSQVEHRVFELWEGDKLVAVTAGFAVGSCYHDYSMATLVKDKRSCGHILTKVVGHILQRCGYSLWYWGYEVEYMKTYKGYGGRLFDRKEFAKRWFSASEEPPMKSIETEISCGNALVQPKM